MRSILSTCGVCNFPTSRDPLFRYDVTTSYIPSRAKSSNHPPCQSLDSANWNSAACQHKFSACMLINGPARVRRAYHSPHTSSNWGRPTLGVFFMGQFPIVSAFLFVLLFIFVPLLLFLFSFSSSSSCRSCSSRSCSSIVVVCVTSADILVNHQL